MALPPSTERRSARTEDTLVALARLFEAARQTQGLVAVVLSDAGGLPIAGGGSFASCEDLAARCAVLAAAGPVNDLVPSRLDVVQRAARVRRLSIDGIEVLLCAEGEGTRAPLDRELDEPAAGCRRILGEGSARRSRARPTE